MNAVAEPALTTLDEARQRLSELAEQFQQASQTFQERKDSCNPKEFSLLSATVEQLRDKAATATEELKVIERQHIEHMLLKERIEHAKQQLVRRSELNGRITRLTEEIDRVLVTYKALPGEMDALAHQRNRLLAELATIKEVNQ